jgi:hypothetical protein
MTDTATTAVDLGTYKGHDVLGATVSIRNTGHGLEEAMGVDPVELELGERVYVVLECEVEKHRYDPIKDTHGLQLVNMLKAGRATIVDGDLVRKHLDEQQARIDEAAGQQTLDFDGVEPPSGEPEQVGEVIDGLDMFTRTDDTDPLDDAEAIEQSADWRNQRTRQLDELSKDELRRMADSYGIPGRGKLVKAELVEAIVDHEDENGATA